MFGDSMSKELLGAFNPQPYRRPNNLAAEFARRKVNASGSMDGLANQIRSEMGITKNTGSVPGGPALGGQAVQLTHRSSAATPSSGLVNGISVPGVDSPRQDLSNRWGTGLISDGRDWKADFEALDRAIQDGSAIPLGQVGGVQAPVPMRDTNMGMIDKPMVSGANPTSDTRMMSGAGINTYSRQPAQPANPVNRQTGNVPFFPRMMSNPIQQTLGGGQDFSNMHPAFRQQMPNTGFLTAAMAPVHQIMQQRFNAPMPQNYGQWK